MKNKKNKQIVRNKNKSDQNKKKSSKPDKEDVVIDEMYDDTPALD